MAVQIGQELLVVLLLILANGFFAAAEISLLAARRGKLVQWAEEGDSFSRAALKLANAPDRFLPALRIAVTIVVTLVAVFAGVRLVADLRLLFESTPLEFIARNAEWISLCVVVVVLSFLQILVGGMIAKRVALGDPARIARLAGYPIVAFLWLFRPILWAVNGLGGLVLRTFGFSPSGPTALRREDIQQLLEEGEIGGVLNAVERRMAAEALRLGDRSIKDVMQPRIDIDGVDVDTPPEEVLGVIAMAGFTRLPIYEGDLDHIIGFVHVKDVVRQMHLGWKLDLRRLLHPALFVPETLPLDKLLLSFREHRTHLAVVLDEFGGTEGLVTLDAVLGELIGEIKDEHSRDRASDVVKRDDGSWLIDGMLNIDDFLDQLDLRRLKLPSPRSFSTIAGLILEELGRLPRVGEKLTWQGVEIEVVDMDGPRIDRLLVRTSTSEATEPHESNGTD